MGTQSILITRSDVIQKLRELDASVFQDVVNNIKVGRFKRSEVSKDYQDRMTYTRELRRFVYNPAVLDLVFSDGTLKESFFRTFGYTGQMDFTIYPSCWLRDIPLLDFGKGVYMGDGIVLGTNQVSVDQKSIRVGSIKIGDKSIFDQRCVIGYGSSIGSNCIVGFQVIFGLKCCIGNYSKIGGLSRIEHNVSIGNNVVIGPASKIGSFVIIDDNISLPEFSSIASFSHVTKEGVFNRRNNPVFEVQVKS